MKDHLVRTRGNHTCTQHTNHMDHTSHTDQHTDSVNHILILISSDPLLTRWLIKYREVNSLCWSVGEVKPLIVVLSLLTMLLNILESYCSTANSISDPPDSKNCFYLLIFTMLSTVVFCSYCSVESIVRLVEAWMLLPMLPRETKSTTRYGNCFSMLILTVEAIPCSTTDLLVMICIVECFSIAYLICYSATDLTNYWY